MKNLLSLVSICCLFAMTGCSEVIRTNEQLSSTSSPDVVGDPSDQSIDLGVQSDIVGSGMPDQEDDESISDSSSISDGFADGAVVDSDLSVSDKNAQKPAKIKTAGLKNETAK